MAKRRLSVRKIKEVLRLHYERSFSTRQIAKSLSIGRSTVQDYLDRAERAGLSWSLAAELDETSLEHQLYPPVPCVDQEKRQMPSMEDLYQELKSALAGKEELLNRRIGRNELNMIQVCLAIVDAQREYAMKDRDSDNLLQYAEKFWSTKGKKDGLYWETKEGEQQSPLGDFFAKAVKEEGYTLGKPGQKPQPYLGYYYKILKAQGKNAPGGAYDYVVNGQMVGGFALVAYPAEYGASGIMTFIVNYEGVVYQKDLGNETGKIVSAMTKFDPDKTWKKVEWAFKSCSGSLTGRGRYNQEAIPFLNEGVESWGDEDHGCGGSDSAHLDIGAVTISAIYHLFPILQKSEDLISICSPGIYDFLPVIQYQVIFLNDCIFQFVKLSFSAAKISVEIH